MRSAPRNLTRFAAQYSARGLPCERFTAALASRTSCITRGRGGWLDLPRGGLAPPILCQLSWRTRHWVTLRPTDHASAASGVDPTPRAPASRTVGSANDSLANTPNSVVPAFGPP